MESSSLVEVEVQPVMAASAELVSPKAARSEERRRDMELVQELNRELPF